MPVATQFELLDLRQFSARQLRPLLEAEADVWQEKLRWDYRSSTELLLQYLDSHVLPGFVALDRGKVAGYTFCVYEGSKAVVGDAFSLTASPEQSQQMTDALLRRLLEVLLHSSTIGRVESQLLLYETGQIESSFLDAGFTQHQRLFMELDFERSTTPFRRGSPIVDMDLIPWSSLYYQAAAELIHSAYQHHVDAEINDQYCSLHGSLRFLHNIVRFPGCGVFEEHQSWLLRERRSGRLAGMILCSRVAEDVAHITQLCVAPSYRGRGLGRTLLYHAAENLRRTGTAAITLTVTESNRQAVTLYEDAGFFIRHRFDAMVLSRSSEFWMRG
ncbi:MAG TPA: GNAT family N-acetyltransferase [Edaphobacter sp.]|jgi:ribosomal protein S18 acetylase RimI-like enzyme|nr:GNAT family N-acetyltransferase [Edaphobacter sp.]